MGRACVTAVGFALAGGFAADTAHVAHVAPVPDQCGRVLLACVEPIELSPRGMELAGVALRAIRETFAVTAGTTAGRSPPPSPPPMSRLPRTDH